MPRYSGAKKREASGEFSQCRSERLSDYVDHGYRPIVEVEPEIPLSVRYWNQGGCLRRSAHPEPCILVGVCTGIMAIQKFNTAGLEVLR